MIFCIKRFRGDDYVSIVNKVSDVIDIYDYIHIPNGYEIMPQSFKRIVLDIYER